MYSKLHDIVALHRTLELLPAAAYTCDHEGRITYFNRDAARIWGRKPALDDPAERWCGSARLLTVDGQPVPHEQSWMARAIADKREQLGEEAIVERPDHTQVPVLMHVTPILDEDGSLMAAVNILVNISQRKRIETLLARANATKDLYRIALADALRSELASMLRTIHGARDGDRDPEATLQKLERNIEHMKAVVDELVDSPDRSPQQRLRREGVGGKPRSERPAAAARTTTAPAPTRG